MKAKVLATKLVELDSSLESWLGDIRGLSVEALDKKAQNIRPYHQLKFTAGSEVYRCQVIDAWVEEEQLYIEMYVPDELSRRLDGVFENSAARDAKRAKIIEQRERLRQRVREKVLSKRSGKTGAFQLGYGQDVVEIDLAGLSADEVAQFSDDLMRIMVNW